VQLARVGQIQDTEAPGQPGGERRKLKDRVKAVANTYAQRNPMVVKNARHGRSEQQKSRQSDRQQQEEADAMRT